MPSTTEQLRALKDEDFRLGLVQDHQPHPAGDPADEVYTSASKQLNTCEYMSSCWRMCSY
ncbi:hypothetical protein [Streptomyces rubellomurinus]|uniref:Uncharacterized protein n=2 Tax=Streptomyces TaxID=1883 RepID=A0A0F2TI05_STRR3|nr:hypothetical protein [Streptomyces rubellomurinus]KJS52743.1 hypothetical protein VM98_29460 [Streptomyces rubellomurinus subsp. indigoferus]KJS62131.1 hypothetical protein VM95_10560 [Streptomyces rubellomurinus]